jgi:hypothetical protein
MAAGEKNFVLSRVGKRPQGMPLAWIKINGWKLSKTGQEEIDLELLDRYLHKPWLWVIQGWLSKE